jgi:hypothetical protein
MKSAPKFEFRILSKSGAVVERKDCIGFIPITNPESTRQTVGY